MRQEPDYCLIALTLANHFSTLDDVAAEVGCTASQVSRLARGLTRLPIRRHRAGWLKAYAKAFKGRKPPQRAGKAYGESA